MEINKSGLYADIKNILEQARSNAVRAVNFSMVIAYWEIGRKIVEKEQGGNKRAAYGQAILKDISKRLTADFGKGFTVLNLENFRKFYLVFSDKQKSYALRKKSTTSKSNAVRKILEEETGHSQNPPAILHVLRRELSWTHYRFIDKDRRRSSPELLYERSC